MARATGVAISTVTLRRDEVRRGAKSTDLVKPRRRGSIRGIGTPPIDVPGSHPLVFEEPPPRR
jgi:hypothetical protein